MRAGFVFRNERKEHVAFCLECNDIAGYALSHTGAAQILEEHKCAALPISPIAQAAQAADTFIQRTWGHLSFSASFSATEFRHDALRMMLSIFAAGVEQGARL